MRARPLVSACYLDRMRRLAAWSLALALCTFGLPSTRASASVSIAVGYDALLRSSSRAAIVTPLDARSVWENDRIYTYTRVRVDTPVAGAASAGEIAWVRTMGGIVGKIGQVVDGEAVLTTGRPSLLFLHDGPPGALEVTARAQGQYAIVLDAQKVARLSKSSAVGALLPPPPRSAPAGTTPEALASDLIEGRAIADVTRDIAAAWSRLHAP